MLYNKYLTSLDDGVGLRCEFFRLAFLPLQLLSASGVGGAPRSGIGMSRSKGTPPLVKGMLFPSGVFIKGYFPLGVDGLGPHP